MSTANMAAIAFIRNGGNKTEIYTDADPSVVSTQDTNLQSTNIFSGGTFDGVAVLWWAYYADCTVNNFLNDRTTVIEEYVTDPVAQGVQPVAPNFGADTPLYGVLVLANGDNDDVSIEAAHVDIIGPTGAFALTGILNPYPGRKITINDPTGQVFTIKNDDAGSTAGCRIITPTGADVTVALNQVGLVYSGINSCWNLVGWAAS